MTIAEQLKAARSARGETLQQAAVTMCVTLNAVARWERGERTPTGLYRLAVERYIEEGRAMKKRKGFTLVELLVVMAIMALLGAVAAASIRAARRESLESITPEVVGFLRSVRVSALNGVGASAFFDSGRLRGAARQTVGGWHFEQSPAGGRMVDGVLVNGAYTRGEARLGFGIDLAGTGYFDADAPVFRQTEGLSVDISVYPRAYAGNLVDAGTLNVAIEATGQIAATAQFASGPRTVTTPVTFPLRLRQWTDVRVDQTPFDLTIWLDGVERARLAWPAAEMLNRPGAFRFGEGVDGLLDEPRIHSVTSAELRVPEGFSLGVPAPIMAWDSTGRLHAAHHDGPFDVTVTAPDGRSSVIHVSMMGLISEQ